MFSVKDPIPRGFRAGVVYKFLCAGCSAYYVCETTRHFSKRVHEHIFSVRNSHIFKHLQNSEHCRTLCSNDECQSFRLQVDSPTSRSIRLHRGRFAFSYKSKYFVKMDEHHCLRLAEESYLTVCPVKVCV